MGIDHVTIGTSDVDASRAFYERALAPLGMSAVLEMPGGGVGFGSEGRPWFFVTGRESVRGSLHIALRAPDRDAVDAFHREALSAGGTDNGGPGVRERYHPTYYAAFVLDPDGHNIEAVVHRAPATQG
jgi:catechol 2,3-dioxygenase-like lactoylglutathione lyase family enzyme